MKITIIGTGYVGLVTGTCLAEIGNDVVCVDIDSIKIATLNGGGVPILEPSLKELIDRNRSLGTLRFTTDIRLAITHGEIVFIAVGTPADEDGSADLQYVLAAARAVGREMQGFKVVVDKSTVPVGTGVKVRAAIEAELTTRGYAATELERGTLSQPCLAIVSNPEFLKEGAAVEDFMRPERIVIGTEPDPQGERAELLLRELYAPFNRNHDRILTMDVKSAEFTKYAANAMLATRISFMNELANLADVVDVDIERVRRGIGSDPRIGYSFLYAGTGYGGSCFPKDVQALIRTAAANGRKLRLLEAVEAINDDQKSILVTKIDAHFGSDLTGLRFAVWGLAFKPNTDDMRQAPSRTIIRALLQRGATVVAHDPAAMQEARRCIHGDLNETPELKDCITFVDRPMQAAAGADALVIVTEWKAFKSPNFAALKAAMRQPVIFDGRNLYEPHIRELGFAYFGVGR